MVSGWMGDEWLDGWLVGGWVDGWLMSECIN